MDAPDENAMYGIPISFTVIKGHDYVEGLLERDELVNVQLPQKFDRAKLLRAHEAARRRRRRSSRRTPACSTTTSAIRSGSCPAPTRNIKITVPTDTVTAEALYADSLGRRS